MDPLFAVIIGLAVLVLLVWLSVRANAGGKPRKGGPPDEERPSAREARLERELERERKARRDDDNDGGATGAGGIYY